MENKLVNLMFEVDSLLKRERDFHVYIYEEYSILLPKVLEEISSQLPENVKLEVVGYTPSFNDGDVCTHRQYVNAYIDGEECWQNIPDPINQLCAYLDSLEKGFSCVYGTNWKLCLTKDGVTRESYYED